MEFKEYSDKQLIRRIDSLLEELDDRNMLYELIRETDNDRVLKDISKPYSGIHMSSKILKEYKNKYGKEPDFEEEEEVSSQDLDRFSSVITPSLVMEFINESLEDFIYDQDL